MSGWQAWTSGGPRRALGCAGTQTVGVDGDRLVMAVPKGFGPSVTVAAVPDPGTLLRRLDLPPAKAVVTDRLVRQQVAALLPGMDDRLALAWRRDPRHGGVTVAAGPRATLAAAADDLFTREADLVVPYGLALDALLSHGMGEADEPAAWAVDCGAVTWLLLYAAGALVAAEAVASDDSATPIEPVDGVFADMAAALTPDQRPSRLIWVGRESVPEHGGLGVWHAVADDLPPHTGWSGAGRDAWSWLGAGAARLGRQGRDAEGLDLAEAPAAGVAPHAAASPRQRPSRRSAGPPVSVTRWAVVGLWLLAALGLWAWAVASGGARQTAVVEGLGLSRSAIPRLDRGLAVGRYLETSGPSLLAVMDELGQKTGGGDGGWMLDEIQWERDSGLTLRGSLGSADAVAELARAMATMRTLTGVQVRRQAPEGDDQVSYTVVASPSSTFYGAFVEPRKAEATPESEDPDRTPAPDAPAEPEPQDEPAAAATPDPAPDEAAAAVEPDSPPEPNASGPITSIDDPRVQALLAKYPALRSRAQQMARQGFRLSPAQFERLEKSLESGELNP